MRIKIFNNLDELEHYYNEKTNTYNFNEFSLVIFQFDLKVDSDISAIDIKAWDIKALDIDACDINAYRINACNIKAYDINAYDIKANNISYYAVCFARKNIKCNSIKGERENCKHFALDGKVEVLGNDKK